MRLLPAGVVVVVALMLVGASASAELRGIHGYGLSLTLPPDWAGSVMPGEITAIAPEGAIVQLDEAFVAPQGYVRLPQHVRVGTTRLFVASGGRKFFLWVHTTAARLSATDRVLSSIRARPWRAPLSAPRFASSPGWQVGHSGPQPSQPRGYVSAWASTVAYLNSPIDLPPANTVSRLEASGVVVWVGLSRPGHSAAVVRTDPLNLRQAFCTRQWEGEVPGVMECLLFSRVPGRFDISVYVYVRERSRLPVAQAELRRLVLPPWPKV